MTRKPRIGKLQQPPRDAAKPIPRHHRDRPQPPIPTIPGPAARIAAVKASSRQQKRDNETQEVPMTEPTVPLATLAIELGRPIDSLAKQFGDDVLLDPVGFRAVERSLAAQVLDQHRAQQAAKAARSRAQAERIRANISQQLQPAQARIKAIQAAQQAAAARGDIVGLTAHEVMLGVGGDHDRRMDAAGRRWSALVGGRSESYKISPAKEV